MAYPDPSARVINTPIRLTMNTSTQTKPNLHLSLSIVCAGIVMTIPAAAQSRTLFERLGGMERITEIVSETIDRASSDPRSKRSFEGIKLSTVKASVASHLCQVSGGPCIYKGETMPTAHAGLAITSEEFDVMDGYLAQALDGHGVKAADKAELQKVLGAMKPDVIEK